MEHAEDYEHGLREYFRIILKRIWLLIAIFVLSVTGAVIASYKMTPIYRATALLRIEKKEPTVVPIEGVFRVESTAGKFFETQNKLIRSRGICEKVFEKLALAKMEEYAETVDPVGEFSKNIMVEPVPDTYLVKVGYESKDPRLAARVADTIADQYISSVKREKKSISDQAENKITEQIPVLKQRLSKSLAALQEFEDEKSALSFEKRRSIIYEVLSSISTQLTKVKQEIARVKASHKSLTKTETVDDVLSLPSVVNNLAIQEYVREKLTLETRRAELLKKYKAASKPVQAVESKIAIVEDKIRTKASQIAKAINTELEEKNHEMQELQALLDQQEQIAKSIDANMSKYDALRAEVESNRKFYDDFVQRQKELQSTSQFDLSTIQIVDRAEVPTAPVRPKKLQNILLAAVLSLLCGVGLAFLFEQLDDSIKGYEDVDRYVRLPVLGLVPSAASEAKKIIDLDMMVERRPKSSVSEAFRSIRTSLLYTSANNEPRAFVITSAGPQEGKTTASVNLAITFANAGKKVLLVDSDLRKPRIHKTFGSDDSKGLTNYLVGQNSLKDVVSGTEVENLSFLPSGPVPPNPTELLDSDKMKEFVKQAKESYDYIIFDSPPVVAVSDAAVLAAMSDGAIQVIWSGNTSRKLVMMGKGKIESIGAKVIGVILNNLKASRSNYYYYYPRYYKYYGTEKKEPSA